MTSNWTTTGTLNWVDGEVLYAADMKDTLYAGCMPIGSVTSWLKTFTNTPALATGWVECNGQTLSDAASPYNGQVIPNLNGSSGTKRFLRGSTTSGTTGGADTKTLAEAELPSHSHTIPSWSGGGANSNSAGASMPQGLNTTITSNTTGSGTAFSILPSYYEVVFIMRVK